jgi:hypothetical protein
LIEIVDELKISMKTFSKIPVSNNNISKPPFSISRPPPGTRKRDRSVTRQNKMIISNRSAFSQNSRRSISTRSRKTDADQENHFSARENTTDFRESDLPKKDANIKFVSETRAINNQIIEGIAKSEAEPSRLRSIPDMKNKIGRIGEIEVMKKLREIIN